MITAIVAVAGALVLALIVDVCLDALLPEGDQLT